MQSVHLPAAARGWQEVGKLAAIATTRKILSFVLARAMKKGRAGECEGRSEEVGAAPAQL